MGVHHRSGDTGDSTQQILSNNTTQAGEPFLFLNSRIEAKKRYTNREELAYRRLVGNFGWQLWLTARSF
eukprot:4890966-Pyramimonas_sp.AAC.3